MRLLHVTDLHFNRRQFDWLYRQRGNADATCISGDLLCSRLDAPLSKPEQAHWISAWLQAFDTPLFLCSGNHDLIEADAPDEIDLDALFAGYDDDSEDFLDTTEPTNDPEARWLRDICNPHVHGDASITRLDGITIGCIPYANDDYSRYADCHVLLHHLPPRGSAQALAPSGDEWGCERFQIQLQHRLLKPGHILCGHVHAPAARQSTIGATLVSNPGATPGATMPNHLFLDI